MTKEEVDIRPVPVDKLSTWTVEELTRRQTRAQELCSIYAQYVQAAQAELESLRRVHTFLTSANYDATLSLKIVQDKVVRVKCMECNGTGQKALDVESGRIMRKSAFEFNQPTGPIVMTEIPDEFKCTNCQGRGWLLMERYSG